MVNKRAIRTSGRDATASLTIDAPPMGEKDYYALVDGNATVPLWIRHGVTAGNIIDVEASAQLQEIDIADDENIKTLQIKAGLMPSAGNDKVAFSIL